MSRVRSEDTEPEMAVRRMVHGMGFRYVLHRRDLPGTPDLALPRHKKAIFVHGCFWHGHSCKAGRKEPKTNREYWSAKLSRNRERDLRARRSLRSLGWRTLVVWECELRHPDKVQRKLRRFLEESGDE